MRTTDKTHVGAAFNPNVLLRNQHNHSVGMMVAFGDLPPAAIELISQLARGRIIPGTNRYARVSRQWRDADSSSSSGGAQLMPELMQLLVDLAHLSASDLCRAVDWMLAHGQHVDVLVVAARHSWPEVEAALKVAPALTCLKRLEVGQDHSLVHLAPLLGQLPQLQHLAAKIRMASYSNGKECRAPDGSYQGTFINADKAFLDTVPDLEQLCPQLTRLRLVVYSDRCLTLVKVDGRLPRLLPGRLQQLALAGHAYHVKVPPSSLSHLKDLQHLTLHGVQVVGPGGEGLSSQLEALQELCLINPPDQVLLLPPRVTVYGGFARTTTITAMGHLTSLSWHVPELRDTDDDIIAALAGLTGLRELKLSGLESTGIPAVQQVASMARLRSLQLEGYVKVAEEEDMLAALAQCTQLTSLVLSLMVLQGSYRHHDLPVPGQLTGLRSLTACEEVLLRDGASSLVPLTQLTRLHVTQSKNTDISWDRRLAWDRASEEGRQQMEEEFVAGLQQQLQQLPGWPASLQQVLLDMPPDAPVREGKPHSWTFTPVGRGNGKVSVWLEQSRLLDFAPGWVRPFRPCPHLPGVWELQGPASPAEP
jgi:hypothetical protein